MTYRTHLGATAEENAAHEIASWTLDECAEYVGHALESEDDGGYRTSADATFKAAMARVVADAARSTV